MIFHKLQHTANLPILLKKLGVEHIIICPGSRNAPLIQSFYRVFNKNCHSIVDERSAAYYALGIGIATRKPAVCISTSGTAVLNFGPAVAESYFQAVPLIVITADRPQEWINQQDNQAIHQTSVFGQNCKKSYTLPVEINHPDDLWYSDRSVCEAFSVAMNQNCGPVHINIPLREPLYTDLPVGNSENLILSEAPFSLNFSENLKRTWISSSRILVVAGQHSPDEELNKQINILSQRLDTVVVAEAVSNIKGEHIIECPDILINSSRKELLLHRPDLVIYFGGQVVSKNMKNLLRDFGPENQWYINPGNLFTDTFHSLSHRINSKPGQFFYWLNTIEKSYTHTEYKTKWKDLNQESHKKAGKILRYAEFSDLKVFEFLMAGIPEKSIVFAGNSSVIRYVQFFSWNFSALYSNRGTSGIDGCVSTAAGIALTTNNDVYLIVGDLSFLYDTNALWNKDFAQNLKIIVINNKGGGIFDLLDGPSKQEGYDEFFKAYHPVEIDNLAKAYGFRHFYAGNVENLTPVFASFTGEKNKSILEIGTYDKINTAIFSNFIDKLRKSYEFET